MIASTLTREGGAAVEQDLHTPHEYTPHFHKGMLNKDEELRDPPVPCPGCNGALIAIVPCRACKARAYRQAKET